MGIEDHLGRLTAHQSSAADASARRTARDADRAAEASRQLQQLASEALPIIKKRSHPRCLEVLSVTVKTTGLFTYSDKVAKLDTGRVLTLLQGSHVWGSGLRSSLAISDHGEMYTFAQLDGWAWSGPSNPHWLHTNLHKSGNDRAGVINRHLKAVAERSGCVAAGVDFTSVPAHPEPQISRGDPFSCLYLGVSGRLMFGATPETSVDAEEWMAGQFLLGDY